jgi:ABC-type glutathione transport system ATPase component
LANLAGEMAKLFGASGSGKTHLAKILEKKIKK